MNKLLLLVCLILTVGTTLSLAQSDTNLNRATSFAVFASTQVNNTGHSGVAGDLGVSPGNVVNGNATLAVSGIREYGSDVASNAKKDALDVFNALSNRSAQTIGSNLNTQGKLVAPGVYKVNGNAHLDGILPLDGSGVVEGIYVFIIEGNLTSSPSSGVLTLNGSQPRNVFWIVKGSVNFDESTVFQGTVLSKGNINLGNGASIIGRAISLEGSVTLNANNVFLPTVIVADLSVQKQAEPGKYDVGEEVVYTITASNAGPNSATGVVVRENIPAGLEFVSAARPSKGTYNSTTHQWAIGSLANGESATLRLTFRVIAPGTIINTVDIIGDQPDPNPGDNNGGDPIEASCPPLNIAVSGNANVCVNTPNLTYSVAPVLGATYIWTVPAGWTVVGDSDKNVIVVNAGTSSGKIIATVKDQCNEVITAELDVTAAENPSTPTIIGDNVICLNSTDNVYTATGVNGEVTYNWVVTGGLQIVSGQGTEVVVVRNTGAQGGTLSVVASNVCAVASGTASKEITTTTTPAAPAAITGNTEACEGAEITYSVAAVNGNLAYNWSVPQGNGWEILEGQGTREVRVKVGASSGNVAVVAANSCGVSTPVTAAVTVTNRPAAPSITGTATACVGTELTYSVTPVAGADSYTWTIPNTWRAVGNLNSNTITVIVGSEAGNITVAGVNRCGAGAEASIEVTPAAPPTLAAINGPAEVCANSGENVYTIAAVAGATAYNWTVPAGWEITKGSGTNTIVVRTTATGGAISVTATNGCGTGSPVSLNVGISTPPTITTAIIDNSNVCDGLTYSIAAVPGATSYTWTVPAGFTITSGQGTTTIKVTANNANASGAVSVAAGSGACVSPVAATAAIDKSLADGSLEFPKAFSPNNDGRNDTWVISNLTKFSENEVIIFNSWGSEVYKKKNYQNDWNGSGLGQGTYFYRVRVKLCDGVNKEFTGYVTIFR